MVTDLQLRLELAAIFDNALSKIVTYTMSHLTVYSSVKQRSVCASCMLRSPKSINHLTAKLFNLNFHSLEFVSP